ncbi:MAG: hypothetical protein K2K53_06230, partial [Oscillospiraceae bacterium]|nr:hypothetical protein [Oscillospiraceae bacterium]
MAIILGYSLERRRLHLEFAQFCACGPDGYAQLKQRVDASPRLGRSDEFAACHLPDRCRPEAVQLGFFRCG